MTLPLGHSYFLRGRISFEGNSGVHIGASGGDVSGGVGATVIDNLDFRDKNPDLWFLLCQGLLHQDIPTDPARPYMPHPDYYDRFVMACGVAYPNWTANSDGVVEDPSRLGPGFWDVEAYAPAGSHGDRKAGWIYFLPQDTSLSAVVAELFAWFKQYGPIPEDNETRDPNSFWAKSGADLDYGSAQGEIVKERHVFYYVWHGQFHNFQCRGIEAGDLVCEVSGWSDTQQKWFFPRKGGENVLALVKRSPTEWKSFFSLTGWLNENAYTVMDVILAVAGAIAGVFTAGAAAAVAAIAIAAMQKLAKQAQAGASTSDMLGTMFDASVKLGQVADNEGAFNTLKSDLSKLSGGVGGAADKMLSWAQDVGKPLAKVYAQAQALVHQGVDAYNAAGAALKLVGGGLPKIDDAFIDKALTNVVLGDNGAYWAKKAAGMANGQQIASYMSQIPAYAQDAAGFGAMLKLAQLAQVSNSATSRKTSLYHTYQASSPQYMQISKAMVDILGKPSPVISAPVLGKSGIINPASSGQLLSTPAQVVLGVTLTAGLFLALKDYAIGKVFDKILDKVIP